MSKLKKYKTLVSDTLLFGVSDFASKIITFLLIPLYTNVLTTVEYGQLDLLNNVVNLIYPLLTLSIVEATIRFSLDKNEKKNEVLSTALIFVFSGTGLLLLFTPLAPHLGNVFNSYWLWFVALFCGYSLRMLFSYYIRGCKKKMVFAIQGIVQTLCVVILNIVLLLVFRLGLVGYLTATICSYFIATIYTIIAGKILPDITDFHINTRLLKEMLRFSIPMIPTLIAWWLVNSIDKYFIISMVGIGASGVYAVAHKIPTILNTVTQIFNKAWQISAVSVYESKDRNEQYTEIYNIFCFLSMLGCLAINSFAKLLGAVLFAKDYFIAWTYVPPLVISAVFSSMAGFLAQIFTSAKRTNTLFVSTVIGAASNFILNYLFIKWLGTLGAAYATMLSFFFVWLARIIAVRRIVQLQMNYFRLASTTVVLLMHSIVILFAESFSVVASVGAFLLLFILNWQNTIMCLRSIKKIWKVLKNKRQNRKTKDVHQE